ncbi:hypothetical protein Afil01_07600 [Actinorhabdospora filicis]|uniref:DUF305 domain-containing protein n=1 Tax=Actinorhabdospora filicis TaxID=1785913 RepID=A0A9W6W7H8_9ACTN|nr:DUF305 domain-containing protein [Actinorhabdospora filicis]GLZ75953.1 hypothetical protein Afil01_07600 [Actinorhabdospora filicis]
MRDLLRRRPLTVLLLSAVVALTLGLAVGVALMRETAPGEDSPEAGFARDMLVHHSQAVDMGMTEFRNGGDEVARGFGYDIAMTQQAQRGMMETWLSDWGLSPTGSEPAMKWMDGEMSLQNGLMPGMATKEDLDRLRAATGRDADVLFTQLMIAHHQGGVHMADAILKRTDDPRVTSLAQAMKDGQRSEIQDLEAQLTRLQSAAS